MNSPNYRKIIQYLLLTVTILFIISGYGITQHRLVGSLTLGLIDKATFFKLHSILAIPFIALLILHIFNFKKRK